MRGLGHIGAASLAASARRRGERWPVAAGLAASLVADGWLATRAGSPRRDRRVELAVNLADAALWAKLSPSGAAAMRSAVVASLVPTAIETGYRLGAGTEAVPVLEPVLPWEPAWDPPMPRVLSLPWSTITRPGGFHRFRAALGADRLPHPRLRRAGWLVGQVAADLVLPLAAAAAIRRRDGQPAGLGLSGWPAFGAVGGFALARTRDDAQRSTRQVWQRRCDGILVEQRLEAQVHAALAHNFLHPDPRALLTILAEVGSEPAAAALARWSEATSHVVHADGSDGGTTLHGALEGRLVIPAEDRYRYVAEDQLLPIREWIAAAEEALEFALDDGSDDQPGVDRSEAEAALDDAADPEHLLDDDAEPEEAPPTPVEVVSTWGRRMTLRYGTSELRLERAVPELAIRLEPTVPGLCVGMVWSSLTALPSVGGAPVAAAGTAVALQGAAIWRLITRTALERRADRTTLGLVTAGAVIVDVAVGLRQRVLRGPAGVPVCPGTGATQPLFLLLAANWRDLGRERWAAAGIGLGAWAFAFFTAGHRDRGLLANELAFLAMPAAAAASMSADTRREAEHLDATLDRWLATELDAEARRLAAEHVDAYLLALDTVIAELEHPALDFGPTQVARVRRDYEAEAQRLRGVDPLEVINW